MPARFALKNENKKKRGKAMRPELRFETERMRGADLGEPCSVPDVLGEHILQNDLEFLLDEDDEIYEGYGRRKNAYPYRQYNCYTRELKEKEVRTAVLENDFLRAVFLPEYGGRLWELWDKTTGENLLYTNDVLRFSNLAVRNAWFSGGVEWNIGIIGHNPFTTDPLYVAVTETEEGAPVFRMYEYERIRRVTYQMDFWLLEEDRFLNCRMRIVNESAEVVPMYWWSNMAVPEYEGGRVVVPAERAFTYADGAVFKVDIPVVDGVDITDYQKIPRSVDYFFDVPEEKPKYIANVNSSGYGLLQRSTKRLKGRKLFSWGNGQASDHWQEFLTDKAGRYTEIQAGLAKTQYGCLPMAPHTAWEWLEQYGAVQVSEEAMQGNHADREREVTGLLMESRCGDMMEERLRKSAEMAKKKACLIASGSGCGALKERGKWTSHLEFTLDSESLRNWKTFFETGKLHCPEPEETPDEFLIDEGNLDFLLHTLENENRENWYAHYQAGVGLITAEEYGRAVEELKISWRLRENPWACHGLACAYLAEGDKESAAGWIMKGIRMKKEDTGYLKEGFKILDLSGENVELCRVYEELPEEKQGIGKLEFYYAQALHRTGRDDEAYSLLSREGGIVIDDIREGEDSVASLWQEVCAVVRPEEASKIPYQYDFKAF